MNHHFAAKKCSKKCVLCVGGSSGRARGAAARAYSASSMRPVEGEPAGSRPEAGCIQNYKTERQRFLSGCHQRDMSDASERPLAPATPESFGNHLTPPVHDVCGNRVCGAHTCAILNHM